MTAELARARAATGGYVHANAAFDDELGRLRLLQARYDPRTFARLSMFGPLAGTRCLEVGAGAGSVARWLAAQAGPSGQVVATDTNPRFLAGAHSTGVEVRRHDILTDPLEPGRYDLVHCRALLVHLADPLQAVRTMAAAVRPGGWLLIEDADYVLACRGQPRSPASGPLRPDRRQTAAVLRSVGDPRPLPRPAPALARHRRRPGRNRIRSDRLPPAGRQRRGRVAPPLTGTDEPDGPEPRRGRQEELDAVSAATADPSFSFLDALSVAAWGRVPCSGTAQ